MRVESIRIADAREMAHAVVAEAVVAQAVVAQAVVKPAAVKHAIVAHTWLHDPQWLEGLRCVAARDWSSVLRAPFRHLAEAGQVLEGVPESGLGFRTRGSGMLGMIDGASPSGHDTIVRANARCFYRSQPSDAAPLTSISKSRPSTGGLA